MTKPIKSIFDKSYIVEAQAIKAGEKEWPQGAAEFGILTFDEATRKYRWIKSVAKALEAFEEAATELLAELDAGELPTNLTLAEALKESGETLEDLKEADTKANASMGLPSAKPRLSSVIRPTKMVWDIADSMPKASRKEVMEACVAAGIAYGTSRTQYQAWFKASQNANRDDIRQPYEKGEK